MDSREFVDKLFDGIAARVDQFFKAKNIQGGVRCGDDMFSMMDKIQLRKSLDQFRAEALKEFWEELHAEAAVQFDHRHDALRPVETYAQSMVVHAMDDGWSAWLLAKSIIDKRKSDHSTLEKE